MNNKGQAVLWGLMMMVFLFMFGMTIIDPMKDVITDVRAADQLDCTNSSITDGAKSSCLIIDLTLPYFIVAVFSVAGGVAFSRIIE